MSEDLLIQRGAAEALGLTASNEKTHYEALGRFVVAFASAESAVHLIARKLSGLSDQKARVVFGGMRLADLIDKTRGFIQLGRSEGLEDEAFEDAEICLTQLKHIALRRHNLIHRGATYFAGTFLVSNSLLAKHLSKIETETISERMLGDMAVDCSAIFLRLHYASGNAISNEEWINVLRLRSWLYKPPPPSTQNQQRQERSGSQKRQIRASRASRRREAMNRK